jgi:hypothetical protein
VSNTSYQKRFYLTGSINQPTVEDAFAFVGSRPWWPARLPA